MLSRDVACEMGTEFRDESAELEAGVARKREQDRFAREAAEVQQARLDELKREVRWKQKGDHCLNSTRETASLELRKSSPK